MKRYFIPIISLGLISVAGCIRELDPICTSGDTQNMRLIAQMEGREATKTVMSGMIDGLYYPLWEVDDSLAVFAGDHTIADPFTLVSGEGETIAVFEGPTRLEDANSFVAFYPYSGTVKKNGNMLSFELPSVQKYKQGSFPADGFPMIATSNSEELSFRNLCSIVRISLTGSCLVNTITLRTENQYLSGPASVRLDYEDIPTLVMQDGGLKEVTLNCLGVPLSKDSARDFYIVVPANIYSSLTIVIDAFSGSISKALTTEITLNRSKVRPFNPFSIEVPPMNLDNLPSNQIWYKTGTGAPFTFRTVSGWKPFNANILVNEYVGDYGVVVLDQAVTLVNHQAFVEEYGEKNLITELFLPDCVEDIQSNALPNTIESFRVPAGLKHMYNGNIDGGSTKRINRLYGPLVASDGRSVVRDGVLLGVLDKDLEEYITPPEVKIIDNCCLQETHIKTLTLSEGFETLGPACVYAPNLETVNLPESIQSIQSSISGAPKLKGFYGNARCTSPDHLCLIDPGYRSSYGPRLIQVITCPDVEEYVVPEGVGNIGAFFQNWTNLRRIILPESLKHSSVIGMIMDCPSFEGFVGHGVSEDGRCVILEGALELFYDGNLEDYAFPPGIQFLPMGRVRSSLRSMSFSEGLMDIDSYAFELIPGSATTLQSVSFPTTIRAIGSYVFDGNTSLESVYLPVRVPPATSGAPSRTILPKLKVYVPEESFDDYLASAEWASWRQYLTPYHFDNIDPPAPYESTDYSLDGKVTVLQTATKGNGVDLVLMGRGYTDRLIANGTYLSHMKEAMEGFFGPEPFHSFRHLFNVYVVNVVSAREDEFPSICGNSRQYLTSIDSMTYLEYAMKAVPDERINYATISVLHYAPYSILMEEGYEFDIRRESMIDTDYGVGIGFAVYAYTSHGVKPLTRHEVGGHGFGKLYDEYTHLSDGAYISEIAIENIKNDQRFGYRLNVDFTADPEKVRWAHFLKDPRYEKEKLGVYEGANFWGVYRSSENSIMNDCMGGYNAPSREAIYRRMHKIAFGADWEYDYETFVAYDQGARNIRPSSVSAAPLSLRTYEVRDPLPAQSFNPAEWTVIMMK